MADVREIPDERREDRGRLRLQIVGRERRERPQRPPPRLVHGGVDREGERGGVNPGRHPRKYHRASIPASEGLATLAAVITAHTDVVGSLLRPPELLEVRDRFDRGRGVGGRAEEGRGRAVDAAVRLQEEAGMEVVTDGEMRRLSFQSGLPDAVDGFGEVPLEAYLWGDWHGDEVGDRATERPAGLGVREPLRRRRHIAAEDFTYLRGRATAIAEGHAHQPEPLRQPVVADALARRLPHPRRLPRGRGGDHPRRDRRARAARLHVHPARRAALPAPDRRAHSRVLRDPGVDGGAVARPRDRARQLGDERPPRRDLRLPPVPREPGQPRGSRRAGTSRSRGGCSRACRPTGCCSSTTTSGRARSSRSPRCPTTGWSCSAW